MSEDDDFRALLSEATEEAERAGAEALADPEPATPPVVTEPTPEPVATPDPQAGADPEPAADPAPPASDPEHEPWYKKRIDSLTGKRDDERRAREAAEGRVRTLEAMIAAGGTPPADPAVPAPPVPAAPRLFTQEDVTREAQRVAAENAFNAKCNTVFEDGVKAYGKDFQTAIGNLNTAGLIGDDNTTLVQAVLDTDAPALLLNHLGKDPGEAERLLKLSPFKLGAELTRMADRLSKPVAPAPISKVPAPIDPIGSQSPKDHVDLADDNTSDADFFAEFEKKLFRR